MSYTEQLRELDAKLANALNEIAGFKRDENNHVCMIGKYIIQAHLIYRDSSEGELPPQIGDNNFYLRVVIDGVPGSQDDDFTQSQFGEFLDRVRWWVEEASTN